MNIKSSRFAEIPGSSCLLHFPILSLGDTNGDVTNDAVSEGEDHRVFGVVVVVQQFVPKNLPQMVNGSCSIMRKYVMQIHMAIIFIFT